MYKMYYSYKSSSKKLSKTNLDSQTIKKDKLK